MEEEITPQGALIGHGLGHGSVRGAPGRCAKPARGGKAPGPSRDGPPERCGRRGDRLRAESISWCTEPC